MKYIANYSVGGAGGTITTQDEGVTLSTSVTTLNFAGAGVTASGAGATTTITIPGGSGIAIGDTIASGTSTSILYLGASNVLAQDSTNFNWDFTNKRLGIGVTALARLHMGGNQSAAAWTTNGINLRFDAATYTDTSSSGTIPVTTVHGIATPTLVASAATTYTNSATLYIAGAPIASTNVTQTNAYALLINSGGLLVSAGITTLTGGISTQQNINTGNYSVIGGSTSGTTGNATLVVEGAATINYRSIYNGTTSTTAGIGNGYAGVIFGTAGVTTAASGNHPLISTMALRAVNITAGAATISNTATLYIEGPSTATVSGYNSPLWVASGITRFGKAGTALGQVQFDGNTSGTTILQATAAASGTITMPATTGTMTVLGNSTSGASSFVLRDTNQNISINNDIKSYQTVATAAGTTTLTVASPYHNFFTGVTTQTIVLPNATTCVLGQQFRIHSNTSGVLTIQTNGGATIWTMAASTDVVVTATDISTAAGVWDVQYISVVAATGKKVSVSNSINITGTDSTTMTFPSTSATVARTDAAQTFTGTQTFSQIVTTNNAITATANAATVPITSRISTVTNNSAAGLTITITTASAVDGMLVQVRVLDFSAVAQTITWVNTENGEATAPTTSNGSTTLPRAGLFQFNSATTKWRCIAS